MTEFSFLGKPFKQVQFLYWMNKERKNQNYIIIKKSSLQKTQNNLS